MIPELNSSNSFWTTKAAQLFFTLIITASNLVAPASSALDLQQFINNASTVIQQAPNIDFSNPKTSFPISKNTINELIKFEGLTTVSAQNIIQSVDRLLINQAANLQQMAQKNLPCINESKVSIEPATGYSDFDSSLLKISLTACLPNISADRAAETFLSPVFNKAAFSAVDTFSIVGAYACQQNTVKFKGKSIYCSLPTIYKGPNGLIAIKNTMASNAQNSDVPIYMKESLILFQPTPRGLIYRYIGYSRSIEINRFLKGMILDTISQAQRNSISVLVEKAK